MQGLNSSMMNHRQNFCFELSHHLTTAQAFPAGWSFSPTDEEIIDTYLKPKVEGAPLPPNLIYEIDIRKWDPQTLTDVHPPQGGEKWYFFTPRYKLSPNGVRPTRTVKNGFWKATGKDTRVKNKDGEIIGKKMTLVFYEGPSNKKSQKTNWIMHEYVIDSYTKPTRENHATCDSGLLDEWVLCEIHLHGKNRNSSRSETWRHTQAEKEEDEKVGTIDESKVVAATTIQHQTLPSQSMTSYDPYSCWIDSNAPCNPMSTIDMINYSINHQERLPMDAIQGCNNIFESSSQEFSSALINHNGDSMSKVPSQWFKADTTKGPFKNQRWKESSDLLDYNDQLVGSETHQQPSKRQKLDTLDQNLVSSSLKHTDDSTSKVDNQQLPEPEYYDLDDEELNILLEM